MDYFNVLLTFVKVFVTGGLICLIGQILIDKTKLTTAVILTIYVSAGVFLTALGIYQYIVQFGAAGATVPLSGFGYSLAKGVMTEVETKGILGAFTGGIKATAGGISAAVVFGYIFAVMFKPKAK